MNEKETAGASYIITFYREVQVLTHVFGNYINLMLEVEIKYPDANKIEPEVRNVITQQVQEVRLSVMKSYIMYKSIVLGANLQDPSFNNIELRYAGIKGSFIINRDELEKYVIEMNAALVNDVIQSLLVTGQDLYKNVYDPLQQSPS